ncbi:mitochondrial glycoprotein [Phakopsora pachyrhizi]|uniref:Mitochondrial glyco protein n=1 Tax=Phakopsora pachyrhizi TaxID=170000 RepID=A0AAV0AUB2_PHAPC|nr:mitochondrial glycoprotein [Phakopsora pachyrhizi]CAH7671911.1 mitochondrial glyco protein [Phakopsora pachyrhizi]
MISRSIASVSNKAIKSHSKLCLSQKTSNLNYSTTSATRFCSTSSSVTSSHSPSPCCSSSAKKISVLSKLHLRSFSSSSAKFSAGQNDTELINKLEAEIDYEKEAGLATEPEWLKSFKADGTFKIKDEAGSDEIVLTRKFGNEDIRIAFSCSDFEREEADEEIELESEEGEKGATGSCRIRTAISIMKPGKGGMVIDSTTDGTGFDIDNISFYDDDKLALDESSENDWKRRGLYYGPTFVDLDDELQNSFTEFLNERAIGPELAVIVLDLAEHKEQKEYVTWLNKMSNFIKA